MASIPEEEKVRRRRVNASVIGTNAMEGLQLDPETLALMHRFEEGELTREELSIVIDLHVSRMLAARRPSVSKLMAEIGAA
jgi:hypothetical protein